MISSKYALHAVAYEAFNRLEAKRLQPLQGSTVIADPFSVEFSNTLCERSGGRGESRFRKPRHGRPDRSTVL
jgi:hypothetical protein